MLEERERHVKNATSLTRFFPPSESVNLLWVVLEVLRFSQFIILGGSIFSCQDQLPRGYNYLKSKTSIYWGGGVDTICAF